MGEIKACILSFSTICEILIERIYERYGVKSHDMCSKWISEAVALSILNPDAGGYEYLMDELNQLGIVTSTDHHLLSMVCDQIERTLLKSGIPPRDMTVDYDLFSNSAIVRKAPLHVIKQRLTQMKLSGKPNRTPIDEADLHWVDPTHTSDC